MAKAFGDPPALIEMKPACSEGSQSHMENVRKQKRRTSPKTGGATLKKKGNSVSAGAATGNRGKTGGGDLGDPRLFYFRALLDGDRFFSGGGRF